MRNPSRDKQTGEIEKKIKVVGFGRVRGKRACGFSDWRVRACHIQIRLLRVFIHAKARWFSTFVVVYEFSWVSTVCGIFEVDDIKILVFCEYIRAKVFKKYNYAGYNYVNRFIVGIMFVLE